MNTFGNCFRKQAAILRSIDSWRLEVLNLGTLQENRVTSNKKPWKMGETAQHHPTNSFKDFAKQKLFLEAISPHLPKYCMYMTMCLWIAASDTEHPINPRLNRFISCLLRPVNLLYTRESFNTLCLSRSYMLQCIELYHDSITLWADSLCNIMIISRLTLFIYNHLLRSYNSIEQVTQGLVILLSSFYHQQQVGLFPFLHQTKQKFPLALSWGELLNERCTGELIILDIITKSSALGVRSFRFLIDQSWSMFGRKLFFPVAFFCVDY